MRLSGKVALVTGAASGIGRAIADLFEEEGATVIATDIATSGAVRRLDVGDPADWEAIVRDVQRDHGGLDVLVNNAGIVHSYATITEVDLDDWDRVLRVNLSGTLHGMRAAIPLMRQRGGGSIVNMSSIWGIAGANGVAAYQASKGAVRALTKNAAISYAADNIRANSLHPGLVMTPLIEAQALEVTAEAVRATPMGRGAHPREVAYGALFLASDESSFMTGAELVIDGGFLAL